MGRHTAAADQAISRPSVRLKPMFRFSLYRPKLPITVTGHRGTGKTLMYDAIVGKVGTQYVPSGKSEKAEEHRVVVGARSGRTRCEVIIVPGQLSPQRDDALDSMMTHGAFPTGLIHVTCFGHNTVWHSSDRATVGGELALGPHGATQRARGRRERSEPSALRPRPCPRRAPVQRSLRSVPAPRSERGGGVSGKAGWTWLGRAADIAQLWPTLVTLVLVATAVVKATTSPTRSAASPFRWASWACWPSWGSS